MDLIDSLRSAVLQQREEEVTNFFTSVNELRESISIREPSAGVNITVKMCCFNSERLSADNGSRVTLVNSTAHAIFDEIQKELSELNSINRKPYIAQITVWDSKKKSGSPQTGRMVFRAGAVYEFRQVHSVGFFSNIAKGSVQMEDTVSDRIVIKLSPVLKRKGGRKPSGRNPKARALADSMEGEKGDEGMGSGDSSGAPRTCSATITRG